MFLYYQEDISRALVQSQFDISLKQVSNMSLEAHVVCFIHGHTCWQVHQPPPKKCAVCFVLFSLFSTPSEELWCQPESAHELASFEHDLDLPKHFEMCYFGSAFVLEASEDYKYILRFF